MKKLSWPESPQSPKQIWDFDIPECPEEKPYIAKCPRCGGAIVCRVCETKRLLDVLNPVKDQEPKMKRQDKQIDPGRKDPGRKDHILMLGDMRDECAHFDLGCGQGELCNNICFEKEKDIIGGLSEGSPYLSGGL